MSHLKLTIVNYVMPASPYMINIIELNHYIITCAQSELQAILFYGTLMKLTDLPLPRPKGQLWALMHEESPKNNPVFSYNSMMELFNVTSTFRQESNYPLNTQFLRDQAQLETKRYMKTVQQKNR